MSNSLNQKELQNEQEVNNNSHIDDYGDRSEEFRKYYNYYYQLLTNSKNAGTQQLEKQTS